MCDLNPYPSRGESIVTTAGSQAHSHYYLLVSAHAKPIAIVVDPNSGQPRLRNAHVLAEFGTIAYNWLIVSNKCELRAFVRSRDRFAGILISQLWPHILSVFNFNQASQYVIIVKINGSACFTVAAALQEGSEH